MDVLYVYFIIAKSAK